ncbi:NAD(P)H-dependent flavin oxidoreductase [Luethyella okanaganae]|uniref:NAD(P)H-dependent flavin oxidoreductase n=1 Tax=Luethyella okanaganae TaxID=69372 RepID=A0ABW1VGE7_9MICO
MQIGTAFLVCSESAASDVHREAILSPAARCTVLTRVFSGRLARGVPNRMLRELSADARGPAPFPAQNWLTGGIKAEAIARGDGDLMSLWAGQTAPPAQRHPAAELMRELVRDAEALLG